MTTIIRVTPGGLDPYGDPIESTETTHEIDAAIAPRTSSDIDGLGRSGVVVGLELFCTDPCADLRRTDLVEYRGERWEIDGDIGVWESPFGAGADGLTCALKRGEG